MGLGEKRKGKSRTAFPADRAIQMVSDHKKGQTGGPGRWLGWSRFVDLSLIPRTHVKQLVMVVWACSSVPGGGDGLLLGAHWLASQAGQGGEFYLNVLLL